LELWEEDLYELLGLGSEATTEEIRKAYKKKAVELHPDRFPEDEARRKEATVQFGHITNAYNVLKDEEERAEYDFSRRMGFGGANGQGPAKPGAGKAASKAGKQSGTGQLPVEETVVNEHKRSQAVNQYDQAKAYHGGKNWQKAIACYKEAVSLDPSVADYHAYLGLAYVQQGLKTPANKSFEAAFKIDKSHKVLKEHYEPAMSAKTKSKNEPKLGLMAQIMAMFGGGDKSAKGKKGKKGGPKKAGAKR
jgi:curved DNA-binding protein CbpA